MKKINYVIWVAAVLCGVSLAGCGSGGHHDSQTNTTPATQSTDIPGVFSISASPRMSPAPVDNADAIQRLLEAFNLAVSAGATGQMSTFTWHDIEPNVGQYNLKLVSDSIDYAHQHNMTIFVGVQLINTVKREMPDDIASLDFNDERVIARFNSLQDKIFPLLKGKVKYFSIGNEVDVYLRANPLEWQKYKQFYSSVLAHAHQLDNQISVGVTATANGLLHASTQELLDLNAASDVVIATYYPLAADFSMQNPNQIDADFPALLSVANEKPLIFQEMGYAAATSLNSSEQAQAEFLHHVFSQWRASGGKVPFMNWFCLHDFSSDQLATLKYYYGLNNQNFFDYLATLGLRKADGTPRAAWSALLSEINVGKID